MLIEEGTDQRYHLLSLIDRMFRATGEPQIILATIHKSKGLEWDKVLLYGAEELIPSKYAVQEWQKEQERNLDYVARTRARKDLVFVALPPEPKRAGGGEGGEI